MAVFAVTVKTSTSVGRREWVVAGPGRMERDKEVAGYVRLEWGSLQGGSRLRAGIRKTECWWDGGDGLIWVVTELIDVNDIWRIPMEIEEEEK